MGKKHSVCNGEVNGSHGKEESGEGNLNEIGISQESVLCLGYYKKGSHILKHVWD